MLSQMIKLTSHNDGLEEEDTRTPKLYMSHETISCGRAVVQVIGKHTRFGVAR